MVPNTVCGTNLQTYGTSSRQSRHDKWRGPEKIYELFVQRMADLGDTYDEKTKRDLLESLNAMSPIELRRAQYEIQMSGK